MGLLDKILKDTPFSWSGEYEPNEPPPKKKPAGRPKPPADSLSDTKPPKIEQSEIAIFQKHRLALQAYQEKLTNREKEINEREQASLARISKASEDLNHYSKALYETEYKIMDFAKRIEKQELSLIEEIRANIKKFEQYNSSPSENGFEFERIFAETLAKNGFYNVVVTQQSNDYGADITAEKDGVKYVIQCKYYKSAVGIEAVQQVYGAKVHYGAHVAVVATNSVFTHAATVLAKETGVLLWDCEKITTLEENAQE